MRQRKKNKRFVGPFLFARQMGWSGTAVQTCNMCLSPAGKKSLFEQIGGGGGDFNCQPCAGEKLFPSRLSVWQRKQQQVVNPKPNMASSLRAMKSQTEALKQTEEPPVVRRSLFTCAHLPLLFEQVWPCVRVNRCVLDKPQVSYCSGHILRPETRCNSISVGPGSSSVAASHPPPILLSPSTLSSFVPGRRLSPQRPKGGISEKIIVRVFKERQEVAGERGDGGGEERREPVVSVGS